jgi:regulator of protease activity HflC (stomatin/prohibitin superfamily)
MSVALIAVGAVLLLLVLFLISAIKVVPEYERGIVFRLGRKLGRSGNRGGGLSLEPACSPSLAEG